MFGFLFPVRLKARSRQLAAASEKEFASLMSLTT
jgi:hypothetical protein